MKQIIAQLEQCHPYKISQLKGKESRWQTYVKLNGKFKQIKANTKQEIYDKLIKFYCMGSVSDTVESYFDNVWIVRKKELSRKKETIKQIENSFDKYIRGTKLAKLPIQKVKTIELENWANDIIHEFNMTSHSWTNHKCIINGIFEMAYKNGVIFSNPCNEMSIDRNLLRSERPKESKLRIFYIDEIKDILAECLNAYNANGNNANLAIVLDFELALRIGELVALKYTDFDFINKTVHIQRQESDGVVEEWVKKDSPCGYRTLPVSDKALEIVQMLHSTDNGEYLICKDGYRMTETKVSHRFEKIQRKLKYDYIRHSHCIRRTVASKMNADGVPLEEIRKWLGHTDKQTTLKYLYNIYREDETADMHRNNSILYTIA